MTKDRISLIFELIEMFLLFHIGFNFVSAAVVCAILERISGLDPSSVIIPPKYLKLVTGSSCLLLIIMSLAKPSGLLVITLAFSALIPMPYSV